MKKQVKAAAAIAIAMVEVPKCQRVSMMYAARRIADLTTESLRTGKPVEVGRINCDAKMFWAAAYAAGCSRIKGDQGSTGSRQKLCAKNVRNEVLKK